MTVQKIKTNLPLVAIVGRVNVGKSTLFNKLVEEQKALISKIPGTTRDLNFGLAEWQGQKFEVVDTGGIFELKTKSLKSKNEALTDSIVAQTEKKAREILERADLILLLIDVRDGILNSDRQVAQLMKNQILKTKKCPVILVANKCDSSKYFDQAGEFKKLGLGEPIPIAATSGKGVGDLLDIIIKKLKIKTGSFFRSARSEQTEKNQTKVSIVGRPNVGKSSLLNKILGEERVIVSATPHTTREPQDTDILYAGEKIKLIDTAGIRRKNKIRKESLEKSGIEMSIKKLKESNIVLFVLDMSEKLSAQDLQLSGLVVKSRISVILVANKYDLFETDVNTTKQLTQYIYKNFPFLTWAPIIFTSAQSGRNVHKILKLVVEIKKAREKKIDKEELNDFVRYLMKKMPPPRQPRKDGSPKKSRAYIANLKQVKEAQRPIFELEVTNVTKIPDSYLRYLENNIRQRFGFQGTPITLRVIRGK